MKALEFRGVDFTYEEGSSFSIRNLNFSVEEGEFVAVLGHNGSGKSTLARLSNGLLTADKGEIFAFGTPLTDKNLFAVRRDVGVVFQNPDSQGVASIVEDDVAFGAENIGLPREEIGRRIDFALKAVGMEEYGKSTVSRLSGGQKQRVAVAGVLALKPRVMILDEATAMLDPKGRREIVEVVRRLNREEKITVVMITHFMEEALLADRAVVMNRGEIVLEGAPADIFRRGEDLVTYNLALPRIAQLANRLREGGMPVGDALDPDALACEIAKFAAPSKAAKETKAAKEKSDRAAVFSETHIDARELSCVYNANTPFAVCALDNVALSVGKGEFFGIVGHTGSGKSTFIQHLNGLIRLPSARKRKKKKGDRSYLFVAGFDLSLKKTDLRALRKKVGMVFQYPESQLFAETVFEDVAFGYRNFADGKPGKEETEAAVREALTAVGLDYAEVKDVSPFDLSGGQKRRVAIAGVIVTKPEILILDEPAAGLDPLGKREVMELLHRLRESWCKTIVVVSHDMDEIAENCTRVAVFSEGKVKYVLPPRELFSLGDELYALGLDLPLTAKLERKLGELGIALGCDYTIDDFLEKALALREGAC